MKKKITNVLITGLLLSSTLSAATTSPWLVRIRAIDVLPEPSSATLPLVGGHVNKISNEVVPELDFSYFFMPKLSAELILATTRHTVKATETALGVVNLGKVNVLPPTLTLQYHFLPERIINPYLGVGINATFFYHVTNGPVALSTKYTSSVGPALQAGTDIALNDKWSLNLDAKKIFIQSDVTVTTALGQLRPNVKINPWVFGAGIGYHFG